MKKKLSFFWQESRIVCYATYVFFIFIDKCVHKTAEKWENELVQRRLRCKRIDKANIEEKNREQRKKNREEQREGERVGGEEL